VRLSCQIEATPAETKTKNQIQNMNITTSRKTTKTELQDAVDTFRYSMSWVTGGTKDEILRQAPHAIVDLQKKADKVAELLLNLSKPAMRNAHLCDYASRIPSMLQTYRDRYIAA